MPNFFFFFIALSLSGPKDCIMQCVLRVLFYYFIIIFEMNVYYSITSSSDVQEVGRHMLTFFFFFLGNCRGSNPELTGFNITRYHQAIRPGG